MIAVMTISLCDAASTITTSAKAASDTVTPTTLRIEISTQTPKPNQAQYVTVRLWSGTSVVPNQMVKLYAKNLANGRTTYLGAVTTYRADGAAVTSIKLPAGTYYVFAVFAGSRGAIPYAASASEMVLLKVAAKPPAKKPTYLYAWTGASHQKTTVGAVFVLDAGCFSGSTELRDKALTIAYVFKAPTSTLWSSPKSIARIGSDSGYPQYVWKAPAKGTYRLFFAFAGDPKYDASRSNYVDVFAR